MGPFWAGTGHPVGRAAPPQVRFEPIVTDAALCINDGFGANRHVLRMLMDALSSFT